MHLNTEHFVWHSIEIDILPHQHQFFGMHPKSCPHYVDIGPSLVLAVKIRTVLIKFNYLK